MLGMNWKFSSSKLNTQESKKFALDQPVFVFGAA
jgi:hypothetical protein